MLAFAPPPCAACSGCGVPVTGAVAGTGGWFEAAPGTPLGAAPLLPLLSLTCWLRMAMLALSPWLGANSSAVASVCEKSTSAVTVARRLSRPTSGSSNSKMRFW